MICEKINLFETSKPMAFDSSFVASFDLLVVPQETISSKLGLERLSNSKVSSHILKQGADVQPLNMCIDKQLLTPKATLLFGLGPSRIENKLVTFLRR